MKPILYIARQKNYSSWSLRGWLALRWAGVAFDEREIDLAQLGYGEAGIAEVKSACPNGLVPALHIDDAIIWDSLAIGEWAAEQDASLWPQDSLQRASARSVVAEMHAGFMPLRRDLPMNISRRCAAPGLPDETRRAIDRILTIWSDCRSKASDGPFLFGAKSIADTAYLPIATRFRTYGIALDTTCQDYVDAVLADPDFREWEADCVPDSWDVHGFSVIDGIYR